MKKLCLSTAALMLCLLVMAACGKKMPETLKPLTTEIEGNLGKNFKIVDKEYEFPTISNDMKIQIERITDKYEYSCTKAGIGVEVYDESGNCLAKKEAELEYIRPLEWGDVFPTGKGETSNLHVLLPDWPDSYKGAATFKLTMIQNEKEWD